MESVGVGLISLGNQTSFGKAKGKGEKAKGKNCIDLFAV
jgi:hypothetical protein